jgi:hypothetical protein
MLSEDLQISAAKLASANIESWLGSLRMAEIHFRNRAGWTTESGFERNRSLSREASGVSLASFHQMALWYSMQFLYE